MKRLNKYITDAGYCSRREADTYISQGRVTINGREATLGDMVDEADMVEVDGEKIKTRTKSRVYIVCNKPVGVTCTSELSDKTNIIDFLGYKERIFPVGRLDKDSEGLIILTNDGDIVNKILRAGNNNPKEYIVSVDKPITDDFLARMGSGVNILGITTKPCKIFRKKDNTFVIHLTQGLNRQIRRMCQVLGYKVVRLKRVKVLNISLGNLEPGRWRYFTPEETQEMLALLADSSGTEEASNEKTALRSAAMPNITTSAPTAVIKPRKAKPYEQKKGTYSEYRRKGKTGKSPNTESQGASGKFAQEAPQDKPGKSAKTESPNKSDKHTNPEYQYKPKRSTSSTFKSNFGRSEKADSQSNTGRSERTATQGKSSRSAQTAPQNRTGRSTSTAPQSKYGKPAKTEQQGRPERSDRTATQPKSGRSDQTAQYNRPGRSTNAAHHSKSDKPFKSAAPTSRRKA